MVKHKKTIWKKISAYDEFFYPIGETSMFLLPDGRLFGKHGIFAHQDMLKEIFEKKIKTPEMFTLMTKYELIRVIINKSNTLFINTTIIPSVEQRDTLESLVVCGKYKECFVDVAKFATNAPSIDYIYKILKLNKYGEYIE